MEDFDPQMNAKVPAVIIFGDSSVDSGNNNQLSSMLKSNFHPYGRDFLGGKPTGRFSNGKVPGDFISEEMGCKSIVPAYLDPSYSIKDFATGVCFASAGTGYDNATSDVLDVMPLWKEVEYFKEYQKLPLERATNLFSGGGCNEEYNKVARDFNRKLGGLVMNLNKQLPGFHAVLPDTYGILLDIIKKPSKYVCANFVAAEVAILVQKTQMLGRGENFRFVMRGSLAIEGASF
ncbi:hypothetical protein ACHQM5_022694 [Ranunculus cassubicifolius]